MQRNQPTPTSNNTQRFFNHTDINNQKGPVAVSSEDCITRALQETNNDPSNSFEDVGAAYRHG